MRLPFLPSQDGYSARPAISTIDEVELEGGQSARRRVLDSHMIRFNVSYRLRKDQYEFFIAFYEAWLRDRTPSGRLKYFDTLLIYQPTNPEYPLHNFKCIFIEEPVTVSNPTGLDITVSTVLEGYLDNWWPMSALFPLGGEGSLSFGPCKAEGGFFWLNPPGEIKLAISLAAGQINQQTFHSYAFEEDAPEYNHVTIASGVITQWIFHKYGFEDDAQQMNNVSLASGNIRDQLVTYAYYVPESITFGTMKLEGGSLT
jgi:hypothetical protein